MKNIVLLGGSNSVMVNGLQKGLKEYANVTNLALGDSTSVQNLYELCRLRNQETIKSANLIITESNINEIQHMYNPTNEMLEHTFRILQYFYSTLYKLNKPICIIILPFYTRNYILINKMHRFLANWFGFNIIDMSDYYNKKNLIEFGNKFGPHQLAVIHRYLGKEIAKNIDIFKISKKSLDINIPEFKIATPENMQRNGNFKIFNPNNSMYNETVYRLDSNNSLQFSRYIGYEIIAIHCWMLEIDGVYKKISSQDTLFNPASIILENHKIKIVKRVAKGNVCFAIMQKIVITTDLVVKINKDNLPNTEHCRHSGAFNNINARILPYFDLIAFLLCKPNPKMKLFDLSVIPTDIDIEIDKDIDRSYLIPNIVFFKDSMEFIDEYIGRLYPNITKHIDNVLTPQIINRVKEQLSQTKINPQKEPTSTIDLEKQITAKIKNHLSYKLGEALIRANKNWYKGGYIKFIFEVMRINKEHKK